MKIKTKLKACFVCILSLATGIYAGTATKSEVDAATSATVTFEAVVKETLSVTITPSLSTSANINTVMTNSFTIDVQTNNASGYTATMNSGNTNNYLLLNGTNTSYTIPSITADTAKASLAANTWGFSTDNSTYKKIPLSSDAPALLKSSTGATSATNPTTVYFATKIDASKPSGSYSRNMTINVVTPYQSTINSGLNTPTNPSTPSHDTANDGTATYNSTTGNTVYHTTSGSADTTKVISGTYSGPLGATESTYYSTSETTGGSSLTTGLIVASATAAISGGAFFALSKFRGRDDDEY